MKAITKMIQQTDITVEQAIERLVRATKDKQYFTVGFDLRRPPGEFAAETKWEWHVYVGGLKIGDHGERFSHPLLRGAVELAELHVALARPIVALDRQTPRTTTLGRAAGKRKAVRK